MWGGGASYCRGIGTRSERDVGRDENSEWLYIRKASASERARRSLEAHVWE